VINATLILLLWRGLIWTLDNFIKSMGIFLPVRNLEFTPMHCFSLLFETLINRKHHCCHF